MSREGKTMHFYLEGMNCTSCLWLLEKLPSLLIDCESISVKMSDSSVEVARVENGSFAAIARTFDRLGYTPHVVKPKSDRAQALKQKENRRDLIRIGIAAGCTGNIMILAVSLYAGATGHLAEQFKLLSAFLATPVLTYCASPFYKSAFGSLRNRLINIDVPIVAALVAGIAMSLWGLASGTETLFFDSLSMLVFLLLSSRFLLKRIQQTQLNTDNLTSHLLLTQAQRITTDGFQTVSSMALVKGDIIKVAENSVVCADGEIIEGKGIVNTSTLTGESVPHSVKNGDFVFAGTQNLSGQWLMRVEKPALSSRLNDILNDIQKSSGSKPNIVRLADKAGQWFVAIVFTLAALLIAYFSFTNPVEGASRALALVIVTCPCVFGMAIPLSMSLAIQKAAEQGIIIKNAEAVERLTEIKTLFFDKTGTLSSGNLEVVNVEAAPEDRYHLAAAAAIEREQTHPVARAIVKSLVSSGKIHASEVRLLSEGGIEGKVSGRLYKIVPSSLLAFDRGDIKTQYDLICEGRVVARFQIGDSLKTEAKELIEWARANGFTPKVISGDRNAVVSSCARELHIGHHDFVSEASPEQKSETMKTAGADAAMIGDGANDAAALASAAVGIAVTGSLDVSLKAADVYLTRNNLLDIKKLFFIARRTKSAMKRNLCFSLCFNVIAGTLAITGQMTPLWAAVFMPLSSLTVLLSSLQAGQNLSRETEFSWK